MPGISKILSKLKKYFLNKCLTKNIAGYFRYYSLLEENISSFKKRDFEVKSDVGRSGWFIQLV